MPQLSCLSARQAYTAMLSIFVGPRASTFPGFFIWLWTGREEPCIFIGLQKCGQWTFHEESASSYPKNRFFLPRKQVPRQEPPVKDPLAPGHVAMVAQSPWWQIQGRTMESACRWHCAQWCSEARREPDSMCHPRGMRPTHQETAHVQEAGVVANARAGGQGRSDGNLWTGGNH